MGLRDNIRRSSGQFLNDVDGAITDYVFTDVPPGEGSMRPTENPSLFLRLSILQDNSEAAVQTSLKAGSADAWTISKDGRTVTPIGKDTVIGAPDLTRFIDTLLDAGMPENELPNGGRGEPVNFNGLLGKRMRFGQETRTDTWAKAHPRKDRKTGKSYDRTRLIVLAYYGGTAKSNGHAVASAASDTVAADDLTEIAIDTVRTVLTTAAAAKKVVRLADLKLKATTVLINHPAAERKQIVQMLADPDFVAAIPGLTYDSTKGDKGELKLDA